MARTKRGARPSTTKERPGPSRQDLMKRYGALVEERSSWITHWRSISEYVLPRNGRYFVADRDKGMPRHNSIYNGTATKALRTLGAGLMAGATSPARPWFRLSTPDPSLNRQQDVKQWLDGESRKIMAIFAKSNTYRTLHGLYEELAAFGTGADIIMPDFNSVIHHFPLTAGEYCIAQDWRGDIVTLYRRFDRTVGEIVREFGYDRCSPTVKSMWDNHHLDKWITLIHAVEPRYDRDPKSALARDMPWGSYYFEESAGYRHGELLRESGFKRFPAMVPRWATAGGDIYGNGPGMEALGDTKQLQHMTVRRAQVIDYQTQPPLRFPTALKDRDVDTLPGGRTFFDGQQSIESLWKVEANLQHHILVEKEIEQRIRDAYFADLFLMISGQEKDMTATEVAQRSEEKLLMLGPTISRLHSEMLEPMVEFTFETMVERGLVSPPPPSMHGVPLNIEFISMLAQAQQAIECNSIDRFVIRLGEIAAIKPDVLDKLNGDAWVDIYADRLGISPELVVADKNVAFIRNARAKAQAAQEQAAALETASKATKNLAGSPTSGDPNALTDVMGQLTGYNSPSAYAL